MSYIKVENLFLEVIQYINYSASLKENILKFILNFGQKTYKIEKKRILENISFELKEGDKLAIIGENGAGKTTLLKCIAGIIEFYKGNIEIEGNLSAVLEIGTGFNPELTGRENIYFNGLLMGFDKKILKEKEKKIIEFAELEEYIDIPIKYYSTGMNMRLAFSIATLIEPEILVIDELFAGGDIHFIEKSEKKLNDIIHQSKIFICAPHNMEYVRKLCNKILVLKSGKIMYFGEDIEKGIKLYEKGDK